MSYFFVFKTRNESQQSDVAITMFAYFIQIFRIILQMKPQSVYKTAQEMMCSRRHSAFYKMNLLTWSVGMFIERKDLSFPKLLFTEEEKTKIRKYYKKKQGDPDKWN